jgi:predicted glycosyltransferase
MVPLATEVHTPDCQDEDYGLRHFKYPGYKELAYLHPNNFSPNPKVRDDLGLQEGERYFILRFTSLQACHDAGRKGMSDALKGRLIKLLEKRGRVFISFEGNCPPQWRKYRLRLTPGRIHSALYYADIYAGDSGTMASEAAVLGTPAIFMLTYQGTLYYLRELEERYGLLFNYEHNQEEDCSNQIQALLNDRDTNKRWAGKRAKMLTDKIDVTDYYLRRIEAIGRKG